MSIFRALSENKF